MYLAQMTTCTIHWISFSFKKIVIQYFKYRTIHNVNIHEDALRPIVRTAKCQDRTQQCFTNSNVTLHAGNAEISGHQKSILLTSQFYYIL